jgi:thioredoxin reductase
LPKRFGKAVDVAVVGAGPQGLAVAAHLRDAGVRTNVFGEPMRFWKRHMPTRMYLRSTSRASSIADPSKKFSLSKFEARNSKKLPTPIPIRDYIEYGLWFQSAVVPDLDERRVSLVQPGPEGFRILLKDGEEVAARRVVVAAGIEGFGSRPRQFDSLSDSLVSHTFEHKDFEHFSGQRVIVIGGGQSALESAALLHEADADTEVLVRSNRLRWLNELQADMADGVRRRIHNLTHPPTGVGPPGLNWVVGIPDLYRSLPKQLQSYVSWRSIPPAGASWLKLRLNNVAVTMEREVSKVATESKQLRLVLDDGTERLVDHVLLGCGYSVQVAQYEFLPTEIVRRLRCANGYPVLGAGFESSVPGLYFVGASAAHSFGPIMRFVVGGAFAAREVTRHVTNRPAVLLDHAW